MPTLCTGQTRVSSLAICSSRMLRSVEWFLGGATSVLSSTHGSSIPGTLQVHYWIPSKSATVAVPVAPTKCHQIIAKDCLAMCNARRHSIKWQVTNTSRVLESLVASLPSCRHLNHCTATVWQRKQNRRGVGRTSYSLWYQRQSLPVEDYDDGGMTMNDCRALPRKQLQHSEVPPHTWADATLCLHLHGILRFVVVPTWQRIPIECIGAP